MVTFPLTACGCEVRVNDSHFGWTSKEEGFFTDPTVVRTFISVTPEELRQIADKAEEFLKTRRIPGY